MKMIFDTFSTPLGEMTAVVQGDALCVLEFSDDPERLEQQLKRFGAYEKVTKANPLKIRGRVSAYFKGERDAFTDLKLDTGGTAFQQTVWRALQKIPHGNTLSYRELASNIGRPKAQRAVGTANGRNPVAIIIPCHRVIASNGMLAGYAGGVERKRQLLTLERSL
ncbi:MAG: methylated-DNA--[protein]-cysteine S-methyltransferase [Rhodospirillaceae bacterium]|nr:methylated-DNA--[protein]-cysteine S-methyltransferase [Rhodospirillaceae bacterium]MBL6931285.1 methylated-DNA--[protein]-cysteine S-methyltransferase [Rhodospirillales bacterium]